MQESEAEKRLQAAVIASAGGYLRNPVRQDRVTCAVCTTPIEARFSLCFACNGHRAHGGVADAVAPITYAVAMQQSGYVMRGYKAHPPVRDHYRLVWMFTLLALSKHGRCAEVTVNAPVTHWAAVPSLPAKPTPHPFRRIVAGSAPGTEIRLVAAPRPSAPRTLDANHYRADVRLPAGSHVLLLDDTWAKGGHAQSAALAVRRAGAGKVSIMVAARWIKREYADNARFLDGLPDYDPDICPWTGGVCPRRT